MHIHSPTKALVGGTFSAEHLGHLLRNYQHCDVPSHDFPNPGGAHGLGGVNDLAHMVMYGLYTGKVGYGHKTGGFPEFDGWPRWDQVTHQAMHEEWLKRAVDGGMRLMVAHAVNNEWMCATLEGIDMTAVNVSTGAALIFGGPPAAVAAAMGTLGSAIINTQAAFMTGQVPPQCRDMPSVDRQLDEAYAMQSYIDQKYGGAGKGWFRIVTEPEEAWKVMADGKLAVVLGIEVDNLFSCYQGSICDENLINTQLTQYYNRGVRHIFPIHFYDNAFGGSSNGNMLTTMRWKNPMEPRDCKYLGYEYDDGRCNAKGLTDSGKFLIRALASKGMIIDVDHMSARTFEDTMNILEPMNYPVVSGHSGFTEISHHDKNNEGNKSPNDINRIRNVNGMVGIIPHQGGIEEISTAPGPGTTISHHCGNSSETVAQAYLYAIRKFPGQAVALGTDFNLYRV